MPIPSLALCAFIVEQVIQWKVGAAAALAIGAFSARHKDRHLAFTCAGLVVLALLIAH